MKKKQNKRGGKKKTYIAVGLLSALIIILLLIMIIDEVNTNESEKAGSGIQKVLEQITGEDKEDANTDISESEAESEGSSESQEEGTSELISAEAARSLVQTTESGEYQKDESFESKEIICTQESLFSGQFVEDGRDELVENVAAMLVTNNSDQYLDLATLIYDINGETATFVVTGLPAGKSAWVMEKSGLVIAGDAKFTYKGSTTSFRGDVIASTDKITITSDGNMLTAVNNTNETMENVVAYYKTIHTDGNYFGGITYLVDFGTIEPGASSETMAGHYVEGSTEIVRIGWQK